MRAAYYERTGAARDVLVLGSVAMPEPAAGEVRVRLHTSGVNPSDVKSRSGTTGRPMAAPRIIPHSDGGGIIDAVGAGVPASRVGERVWIWNGQWQRAFGTAAEIIVLPAARASLFGAVFLGLGRALGETMAVTFVIGNANRMPDSLYAPASTIASVVANTFPEAEVGSLQLAVLLALGFLLFVVSFAVLALARVLLRQERMV